MIHPLRTLWRRLTPGNSTVVLHAHDEGDSCESPEGRGLGGTPRCMTFRDARAFKRALADDRRHGRGARRRGEATLDVSEPMPSTPLVRPRAGGPAS